MKLSVIIPAYNRAPYLKAAIDSVFDQELPKGAKVELEVIVADDGSTDDTPAVIKRFGDKIKSVTIPHSGLPAAARNAALKLATGDLIAFQDSDDLWAQDKLKKQLPLFDDADVVMSFGNAGVIDRDGKDTGQLVCTPKQLKQCENFKTLLKGNAISTLTVMVRRSALDAVGTFNPSQALRAVEDYELWLRVAAAFPDGLKSLDATLALYRRHDQNISTTTDLTAIERLLNVYDSLQTTAALSDAQYDQLEAEAIVMHENWSRLKNELEPAARPAISVVMGVYNAGEFLKPTIDSVLSQTYDNFEFIIINDGSTDDSLENIRSYDDPRIRLVNQANHGLVYTLNKGVRIARGQFIARQDADDLSLPSRFEKEIALISSNPRLGVVGTYFTYIDEQTGKTGITITGPTESQDIKRTMYFNNPFGHGTTMIRTAVFADVGPYSSEVGPTEDMELWQRIAEKWDFGMVPEALYWYRINPASISHTKGDVQHKITAELIAKLWQKPLYMKSPKAVIADGRRYRRMQSPFAYQVFDQYVANQIDIGIALFRRGSLKTALLTAWGAVRLKPKCLVLFIRPAIGGTLRKMRLR